MLFASLEENGVGLQLLALLTSALGSVTFLIALAIMNIYTAAVLHRACYATALATNPCPAILTSHA